MLRLRGLGREGAGGFLLLPRGSKRWWRRRGLGGVDVKLMEVSHAWFFEVNQSCSDWRRRHACFVLGRGIICISRYLACVRTLGRSISPISVQAPCLYSLLGSRHHLQFQFS